VTWTAVGPQPNLLQRLERRRAVVLAGYRGDRLAARSGLADPDPGVRAAALGAVLRSGDLGGGDLRGAADDDDPTVRRRLAELLGGGARSVAGAGQVALGLLADADAAVAETAAWALGEIGESSPLPDGAVAALVAVATGHADPLAREAAVAALGALGDPAGLPAVLAGTTDRPAIRRRAVLALAPFEGPDVDAALQRARQDRDWQVREAAELLLRPD